MTLSPEFEQALDAATAWERLRFTSQQAAALVKDFRDRGGNTSWAFAEAAAPRVERALRAVEWSDIAGARLIVLLEARFALTHGRDHFLPNRHAPEAAEGRWLLFLHALWDAAERGGAEPHDRVLTAMVQAHAGPMALLEIERRLTAHIGMDAAVALLLMCWPPEYGAPMPHDSEIMQATCARRATACGASRVVSTRRRRPVPDRSAAGRQGGRRAASARCCIGRSIAASWCGTAAESGTRGGRCASRTDQ